MPGVARVGDLISHGGNIVSGSPNVYCNEQKVARLNDSCACAIHGIQPIISASGTVFANSRGVARLGDSVACGATIVTASSDVYADG